MFFVPVDQKFNPFHYWGQNFRIFSWSLSPIILHVHSFEKSYWLYVQNIFRSDSWPPSYITSCLHYLQPSYSLSCSPPSPSYKQWSKSRADRITALLVSGVLQGLNMSPGEEAKPWLACRIGLAACPASPLIIPHPLHTSASGLSPPVLSAETAVAPEIHSAFPPSFLWKVHFSMRPAFIHVLKVVTSFSCPFPALCPTLHFPP